MLLLDRLLLLLVLGNLNPHGDEGILQQLEDSRLVVALEPDDAVSQPLDVIGQTSDRVAIVSRPLHAHSMRKHSLGLGVLHDEHLQRDLLVIRCSSNDNFACAVDDEVVERNRRHLGLLRALAVLLASPSA